MNATHSAPGRHVRWITSSYSAQGNCVEIAAGPSPLVPVRDSKAPHRALLQPSSATWSAFLTALRNGTLT